MRSRLAPLRSWGGLGVCGHPSRHKARLSLTSHRVTFVVTLKPPLPQRTGCGDSTELGFSGGDKHGFCVPLGPEVRGPNSAPSPLLLCPPPQTLGPNTGPGCCLASSLAAQCPHLPCRCIGASH